MQKWNPRSLCVLVTRPAPQGQELTSLIQQQGDHAIFFPTLTIVPWNDVTETQRLFSLLQKMDWVIFISPQAVYHAQPFLPAEWPPHTRIAVMGKGTEKALNQIGIHADLRPEHHFTSESLLNLPELQYVEEDQILIVKGAHGRTVLSETLQQRGAIVEHAIVYERHCPHDHDESKEEEMLHYLDQPDFQFVSIVTSSESLTNLKQCIRTILWERLQQAPILLPSTRVLTLAKQLGFSHPHVCSGLDHASVLNDLNTFRETRSKGNAS